LLDVGVGNLGRVVQLLDDAGFDRSRAFVGSGSGASLPFAVRVVESLRASGLPVSHQSGLGGRLDQAAELGARFIGEGVTVALAVGGGRVIDTVKLAAARTSVELITLPTTLSHDGISSPVASLADKDGRRRSHAAAMPSGIVVDVSIFPTAPPRTLRAGLGDLVSNLTAILDWQLAERAGEERYDAFSAMLAETAALPALDLADLESAAAHTILAKGLLISGLAMAAAGSSRPCSGAEHLVSHSLDEALGDRAAFHGEQVALGTLISAHAHESPLFDTFHRLFGLLGLPTCPEDLKLTRAELVRAVAGGPATRPERYTVLSTLTTVGDAERLVAETLARTARPVPPAARVTTG
jgi:glycerol-1-phosphate dehydrogenase [NAD(P)+]